MPWPVAASIGLKILGRAKLCWLAWTSVVSSPPHPITTAPSPLFSTVYKALRELAGTTIANFHVSYRLRPSCVFASIASCCVHAQARSHATSWRCLVAGLVPDLLVDAAGEVTEFLVTTYQHGQCLFGLYCLGKILVKSCRPVTTMTPFYSGGAGLCAVNAHPTVVKHLLGREVAMSWPSVTNLQFAGLVQHRQRFR